MEERSSDIQFEASLDLLFELVHNAKYKEAIVLISKKHFEFWERGIFSTFWTYILLESTREKLESTIKNSNILEEFHKENILSLRESIENSKTAAKAHNLQYTLTLLNNLEEIYINGLISQSPYDDIHEIEMQKYEDKIFEYEEIEEIKEIKNDRKSQQQSISRNLSTFWLQPEKTDRNISDIINDSIIFHINGSIEYIRKIANRDRALREKLTGIFYKTIKKNNFEFLFQYQHILQYITEDQLGVGNKLNIIKNKILERETLEKNSNDIIDLIIQSLDSIEYLEIKLHLIGNIQSNFTYAQDRELLYKITDLFEKEKLNICLTFANPLKIVVLGLERIKIIRLTGHGLDYLCNLGMEQLIELGISIQNSIGDNLRSMHEICQDKDLQGRKTIIILANLEENRLLENPLILSVTHNMWYSSEGSSKNYSLMSTIYQVLVQRKIIFDYLGRGKITKPRPIPCLLMFGPSHQVLNSSLILLSKLVSF